MGCSLEERHLRKVDPEGALSMTSRWEIDRSRNSPGWIAEGATFRLNSPRAAQWRGSIWRNPEKCFVQMVWWTVFSWFFFCIPWLKQWSDLVSYQVPRDRCQCWARLTPTQLFLLTFCTDTAFTISIAGSNRVCNAWNEEIYFWPGLSDYLEII